MGLSSALFVQARSKPFGEVQRLKGLDGEVTGYAVRSKGFLGWALHWLKYQASGKYRTNVRNERKEIAGVLTRSTTLSVNTTRQWSIWDDKVIRNRKSFLRAAEEMAEATEVEHLYQLLPGAEEGAGGAAPATDTPSGGTLKDAKDGFSAKFFEELTQEGRFESKFPNLGQPAPDEDPDALTMRSLKDYCNSLFDRYLDVDRSCISVSQLKFASNPPLAGHQLSQVQTDFVNLHFIAFVSSQGEIQRTSSVQP